MYRTSSILDLRALQARSEFAGNFPRHVKTVAQATFEERAPSLLEVLRTYPQRRAVHPFVWSLDPRKNARARRGYMARVRSGEIKTDDYGYLRTGALGAGYTADILVTNVDVLVSIRNKASRKAHLYTKGRRQVPGHAVTGWQKDEPIIEKWQEDYTAFLVSQIRGIARTAVKAG